MNISYLFKIGSYMSAVFCLFVVSGIVAQEKIVYPHTSFWHKTEIHHFPGSEKHWGYGFDFVYRGTDNEVGRGAWNSMFDRNNRFSYRPWLNYQFSPYARFSLSPLGYMVTNEPIGKESDFLRSEYDEYRTTFQFFHHIKQWDGRIMHTWRYRYEWRWQELAAEDRYRFFQRVRFRYRIRVGLNTNDLYENHALYATFSNEWGINYGEEVYLNTFNQNRLYAGLGFRFLTAARLELRYVDRIRTRGATGYEFDRDQGVMVAFFIDDLDLLGGDDEPQVRFFD